jgi:hypothetical protein
MINIKPILPKINSHPINDRLHLDKIGFARGVLEVIAQNFKLDEDIANRVEI